MICGAKMPTGPGTGRLSGPLGFTSMGQRELPYPDAQRPKKRAGLTRERMKQGPYRF